MIGKTPVRDLLKTSVDPLDAEVLLAFVLQKDRVWVKAHGRDTVSARDAKRFRLLLVRRTQGEPVAYLTGSKDFFGRSFWVRPSTLIPRPETELLVDAALAAKGDVYWDVGTGSGAIAVTLACERPRAAMLATDISVRALAVAQQNARRHGARIHFLKSNLLQPPVYRWLQSHTADHLVITANLPYLPMHDQKMLAKDVVQYEPPLALFSGDDGLHLIKRFLRQLSRHVADWGFARLTVLLEFDPPQAQTLTAFTKTLFPNAHIALFRDLAHRERLLQLTLFDLRPE